MIDEMGVIEIETDTWIVGVVMIGIGIGDMIIGITGVDEDEILITGIDMTVTDMIIETDLVIEIFMVVVGTVSLIVVVEGAGIFIIVIDLIGIDLTGTDMTGISLKTETDMMIALGTMLRVVLQ